MVNLSKWLIFRNNPPTLFDKIIYRVWYIAIGICFTSVAFILYPNTIFNITTGIWITNTTDIHDLALNLTHDCNDTILNDFCKCNNINRWIYDNIEYDLDKVSLWDNSPETTLDTRIGVCRHNAILACSMLESMGIECNINTNYYIQNNINDGHAWFEVKTIISNDDFMIICDPTKGYTCSLMSMKTYIKDYGKPID